MNTFEIAIGRRRDERWPIVALHETSGSLPVRREAMLELDLAALRRDEIRPREYGRRLGEAVFVGPVRDLFVAALSAGPAPLRVLLFVEDPDLRLRWERVAGPLDGEWRLLGLDQRAPFSLYLPSVTERRFPPFGRRDLRALVVVASPPGLDRFNLPPFDEAATVASVTGSLGEIPFDVLASTAGAAGPATLDAVCARLTSDPYTLLHVVCHGLLPQGETESSLVLCDDAGAARPVRSSELVERLANLAEARGLPHFTFLASCETASVQAEAGLGGLGQRLVRDLGMPAVLAMTERVSVETAHGLAAAFYARLREHGEPDRALSEACAGLAGRADVLVPALFSRLGGRPLFSDTLDRDLTPAEVEEGLRRLDVLLEERAPVLRPQLEAPARVLRTLGGVADAALSEAARRERDAMRDVVNSLSDEALGISFPALALGAEPEPYDGRCPFPGLYAFKTEDRQFFFGRRELVEDLAERLRRDPFLAVLGPSGCGKSSVVLAGLVPHLQEEQPALTPVVFTPGADPVGRLEAAVAALREPSLLIVDQFEELFTLAPDLAVQKAFVDRLLALGPQRIVMTMRADFWGDCAVHERLAAHLQERQRLVGPMNATELRRAIDMQARAAALRFEADLSGTIVDDVEGEPGAMPLLQHALFQLWHRRHGRWLRAAEYNEMGRVRRSIARTADEFHEALRPEERARLRYIFLRLTRVDDEGRSTGDRRDTRRRVLLRELIPAGAAPGPTRDLVSRLADARLVVTTGDLASDAAEVEVAHEALIRYWPLLAAWIDEDRAQLRLRDAIARSAAEWKENSGDESVLFRGRRLEDAEQLARDPRFALNETEQAFVAASVAHREREREEELRRQEQRVAAAEALAEEQRARAEDNARLVREAHAAREIAERERARAEEQARASIVRELAAAALLNLEPDPELSVLLGLEAVEVSRALAPPPPEAADALHQAVETSRVRARLSHPHPKVNDVVFSPDGSVVATASGDSTARLWETASGRLLRTLPGHAAECTAVAFRPDGAVLATASWDRDVRLWDVATGQPAGRLTGHADWVLTVAWSSDGTRLASGAADGTVRVWDPTSGTTVLEIAAHRKRVNHLRFSADGTKLATASGDASMRLWELSSGEPLLCCDGHGDWVTAAAFLADGSIATASYDGAVRVWEARTGLLDHQFEAHEGAWIAAMALSADGSTLATAGWDRVAKVWDAASGQPRMVLAGHTEPVTGVVFSPDGEHVATSAHDGTARIWSSSREASVQIRTHRGRVSCAAFSPDATTIATRGQGQDVKFWDASAGRLLSRLICGPSDHPRFAYSPDGTSLLVTNVANVASVYDVATNGMRFCLTGHSRAISGVAWAPDASLIATGGWDEMIRVWNGATGAHLRTLEGHADFINWLTFLPDGRRLVSGADDKLAIVWDAATGAVLHRLVGHTDWVDFVDAAPDGRRIVTVSHDTTGKVWDAETGQEMLSLLGHTTWIRCVRFSPDGTRIATAAVDGTVRLWDAQTGAAQLTLEGHAGDVWTVGFSPDGARIVSGSVDGTVRVWDASSGKEMLLLSEQASAQMVEYAVGSRGRLYRIHVDDLVDVAKKRVTRPLTPEERRRYLHQE